MYERLAVCMWASVSMRRAALCAASVSSWGGTVRNARVLHVACRFAKTARLRATSFAWGLRRPAICGGLSWSRRRLLWAAPAGRCTFFSLLLLLLLLLMPPFLEVPVRTGRQS